MTTQEAIDRMIMRLTKAQKINVLELAKKYLLDGKYLDIVTCIREAFSYYTFIILNDYEVVKVLKVFNVNHKDKNLGGDISDKLAYIDKLLKKVKK